MNAAKTAAAVAALMIAGSAAADGECLFPCRYAGAAAAVTLPQGGARMSRSAGAVFRAGRYLSDVFAVEGELGVMENRDSLAARAVVHAQSVEWFGKLFGYERFDPFATAGVRIWAPAGQAGATCGIGAFYYLGDSWAIRADAEFSLGVRFRAETAHSIAVGLQYSF